MAITVAEVVVLKDVPECAVKLVVYNSVSRIKKRLRATGLFAHVHRNSESKRKILFIVADRCVRLDNDFNFEPTKYCPGSAKTRILHIILYHKSMIFVMHKHNINILL